MLGKSPAYQDTRNAILESKDFFKFLKMPHQATGKNLPFVFQNLVV